MWWILICSVLFGGSQGVPVEAVDVIIPSDPVHFQDIPRNDQNRIIGGWLATEGQFPYKVSVRNVSPVGGVSACGGSIIHNEWILTAAHCVARRDSFVIRLGLTNLTRPELIMETVEKYVHPDYNVGSTAVQVDEIALLKLPRRVEYGQNIQPIRVQSSERQRFNYDGLRLTTSGFGRNNDIWLGGYVPEVLSWVYQLGITNEECLNWYPNSQTIKDQTLCAKYYNHTSQNICTGDSGGPLTMDDLDGSPTIVGITNFGYARGCNTPNPSGNTFFTADDTCHAASRTHIPHSARWKDTYAVEVLTVLVTTRQTGVDYFTANREDVGTYQHACPCGLTI